MITGEIYSMAGIVSIEKFLASGTPDHQFSESVRDEVAEGVVLVGVRDSGSGVGQDTNGAVAVVAVEADIERICLHGFGRSKLRLSI